MKNLILAASLIMMAASPLACMTAPSTSTDSSVETGTGPVNDNISIDSPTPNTGYQTDTMSDATVVDPEGDLAPPSICKKGEVEMRQSGKIVCTPAGQADPRSTMTGR